eukprot:8391764-Alexandrium_andersonii.AAC.1
MLASSAVVDELPSQADRRRKLPTVARRPTAVVAKPSCAPGLVQRGRSRTPKPPVRPTPAISRDIPKEIVWDADGDQPALVDGGRVPNPWATLAGVQCKSPPK